MRLPWILDSGYREGLRHVNTVRRDLGLRRLWYLRPGLQLNPQLCPIAWSIKFDHVEPVSTAGDTCVGSVGNRRYWHHSDKLTEFLRDVDFGRYPRLVL